MIFEHHPDGYICINNLILPLNLFKELEPDYFLPEPATHRIYRSGKYHQLFDLENQWGGEFPWEQGEEYLSKISVYEAALQKFLEPPELPPMPPAPDWQGLTDSLRGSALFNKVYQRSESGDPIVSTALALLLSSLGSPIFTVRDLDFALTKLKRSMGEDLSVSDIEAINSLLAQYNFGIVIT